MARRIACVAGPAALDAYALRRTTWRREAGEWRQATDVLFPGYVLVETADPDQLEDALGVLVRPAQLLRAAGNAIATLEPEEAALIRRLAGSARTVEASVGEIVKGSLHVSAGPLTGLEGLVSKIDRHRRAAYLAPAAFRTLMGVSAQAPRRMPRVALEVVSKT